MDIFKNADGYAPLLVNLEGYWDKPLAELPRELRAIVEEHYDVISWENLGVANRRNLAAQLDYQHDPKHEPSTYFGLICFADELTGWIEKARLESKDAAVVVLRDVADKIKEILECDRVRVGSDIQKLRVRQAGSNEAEKPLSTTERNSLLTIIAVLCKEAKLDYTKSAKTAGLIQSTAARMNVSIGETTIENHLKKIPDALGTRTK